jgi:hypothetical protein
MVLNAAEVAVPNNEASPLKLMTDEELRAGLLPA